MSVLRRGDEDLHYSDNSHRWIAPPNQNQNDWDAMIRTHLDHHLATMGGPADRDKPRRPPRRPGG